MNAFLLYDVDILEKHIIVIIVHFLTIVSIYSNHSLLYLDLKTCVVVDHFYTVLKVFVEGPKSHIQLWSCKLKTCDI